MLTANMNDFNFFLKAYRSRHSDTDNRESPHDQNWRPSMLLSTALTTTALLAAMPPLRRRN